MGTMEHVWAVVRDKNIDNNFLIIHAHKDLFGYPDQKEAETDAKNMDCEFVKFVDESEIQFGVFYNEITKKSFTRPILCNKGENWYDAAMRYSGEAGGFFNNGEPIVVFRGYLDPNI